VTCPDARMRRLAALGSGLRTRGQAAVKTKVGRAGRENRVGVAGSAANVGTVRKQQGAKQR